MDTIQLHIFFKNAGLHSVTRILNAVTKRSGDLSSDADELDRLLGIVSDKGLKALDLVELDRLRILLEAKDYGDNKKAIKSKAKLLKQINSEFYDSQNPRRLL
jgi:hypothetical protein